MAKKIKIHYYAISSNIVGTNIDMCLNTLNGLSIPQRIILKHLSIFI